NSRLIQAQLRCFSAPKVFDADVAAFRQLQHDIARGRVSEIQRNGALAPIDGDEIGAPRTAMRWHSTGIVTAVDPLDFDDIGAQIGQDHGGRRPGHNRAEVQNAYACQWRGQRVEDTTGPPYCAAVRWTH